MEKINGLEASFAQERLWLTEQLQANCNIYNVGIEMAIEGHIDYQALGKAMLEIIYDNNILRTLYFINNGAVKQLLVDSKDVDFTLEIIEGVDDAELCEYQARLDRPFNIRKEIPIRAGLHILSENSSTLTIQMHHIATDGWSLDIFNRLLIQYYLWAIDKQARPKICEYGYSDYANWQRRWLADGNLNHQVEAWRHVLTPLPIAAKPLSPIARKTTRGTEGSVYRFSIDKQIMSKAEEMAAQMGVTAFHIYASAFSVFLNKVSLEDDFVIGTPVAGRRKAEFENVLGFFVNMLPLRCDLSKPISFEQLCIQMRDRMTHLIDNQDVPFEHLVNEFELDRSLSQTPLFQTVFAYHENPLSPFTLNDANVSTKVLRTETAKYDWFLQLEKCESELYGNLEYSTEIYDQATVSSFCDYFHILLKTLVNAPTVFIEGVSVTSDEIRAEQPFPYSAEKELGHCVITAFKASVTENKHEIAIDCPQSGRKITYTELDVWSDNIASILLRKGVKGGSVVAVCGVPSLEFVASIIAVRKISATYLPIDASVPLFRQKQILTAGGAVFLISTIDSVTVSELPELTLLEIKAATLMVEGTCIKYREPLSPCYIMFTSGSSGDPKGVMIDDCGIIRLVKHTDFVRYRTGTCFAHHSNVGFDASTFEIWGPLLNGGKIVCFDKNTMLTPELFTRQLIDCSINVIFITTQLFHEIVNYSPAAFRSLDTLIVGGEVIDSQKVKVVLKGNAPPYFYNAYGPTECTTFATMFSMFELEPHHTNVPIGKPIGLTDAFVIDQQGNICPPYIPGELCLGGPGLAIGYLNDQVLTDLKFTLSYFNEDFPTRIYRTGDFCYLDSNDVIYFHGRMDSQIKINGFRVEYAEVEQALSTVEGVQDLAVQLHTSENGDKCLVGFIVTDTQDLALEESDKQFIDEWNGLYQGIYQPGPDKGFDADYSGWMSSFTGQQLPESHMEEWVNQTVERILTTKPTRILEIGCGTGLLMRKLADKVERYVGIDFSANAIEICGKITHEMNANISLYHLPAHDLNCVPFETFDLVIFNSIVQYFPSADYLKEAIFTASDRLIEGAHIFLGDIRGLALLESFHCLAELNQIDDTTTATDLLAKTETRTRLEKELVIDPSFFIQTALEHNRLSDVRVMPKLDKFDNEMSMYRYDALISVSFASEIETENQDLIDIIEWNYSDLELSAFEQLLENLKTLPVLITGIPNSRLILSNHILHQVKNYPHANVKELVDGYQPSRTQVTIDILKDVCKNAGFEVDFSWLNQSAKGSIDLLCYPKGENRPSIARRSKTPYFLTNDPTLNLKSQSLEPKLRDYALDTLPVHMRPSMYVFLEKLPVNANGKIDRINLEKHVQVRTRTTDMVPPNSVDEKLISELFSELLKVWDVSLHDNFFDLGGNSLLVTRMLVRLEQLTNVSLTLSQVFENPTVVQLAKLLSMENGKQKSGFEAKKVALDKNRLSPSLCQQRLLFLESLHQIDAYNSTFEINLEGTLEPALLVEAFNVVLARHDSFQCHFNQFNGDFYAVIPEQFQSNVRFFKQTDMGLDWDNWLSLELNTSFDLTREAGIRASIVQFEDRSFKLVITVHHIISDGWTIGILTKELTEVYTCLLADKPISLGELAFDYFDYAHCYNRWIKSEEAIEKIEYWRTNLQDAPPLLAIPTDKPRPSIQSFRGASIQISLPVQLTKKLRLFTKDNDVSLFMLLMSTFSILVGRLARQDDLVLGAAVANRRQQELEEICGFFVNSMPLRIKLLADKSFKDILMQVKSQALECFEHQEVPFEEIVQAINPIRTMAYSPLFQHMFVLQNTPSKDLSLGEAKVKSVSQPIYSSKFDMTISLEERQDDMGGYIEYATDLYCRETIEKLWQRYTILLEQVLLTPNKPISCYDILLPNEYLKNEESLPIATRFDVKESLAELFVDVAEAHKNKVAIRHKDSQITYLELNRESSKVAVLLRQSGVKPSDRIGIIVGRTLAQPSAIIGALKNGNAYVPMAPNIPSQRFRQIVESAGIGAILCDENISPDFIKDFPELIFIKVEGAANCDPSQSVLVKINPEELAYIIYTSGSTGIPKGVMTSHYNVIRMYLSSQEQVKFSEGDVWSLFHSATFDFSVWEFWGALLYGGTLMLVDDETSLSPDLFIERMLQSDVTVLNQTPSSFKRLIAATLESGDRNLWQQLRLVILDGEPLNFVELEPWFKFCDGHHPELLYTYGITETTIHATYRWVGPEDVHIKHNLCGVPFSDLTLHILDEHQKRVPKGATGEIYFSGGGVSCGYLGEPELTAKYFLDNQLDNSDGKLYRTGDLGCITEQGELEVLGRVDHQVKIRGFRVELGEVEAHLKQVDGVTDAVAIAIDSNTIGACVRVAEDHKNDERAILAKAKEFTLHFLIPDKLRIIDKIPLNSNGKADREQIKTLLSLCNPTGSLIKLPHTANERLMANVWKKLLGVSQVGVEDNFFNIGGNSFQCLSLAREIKLSFGVDISLTTIYRAPTIVELMKEIDNMNANIHEQIVVCFGDKNLPAIAVLHPIGGDILCYNDMFEELTKNYYILAVQHPASSNSESAKVSTLESMARLYVTKLREVLGEAPNLLVGWSFGGLVAHEMARQLELAGNPVRSVVMIDSPLPGGASFSYMESLMNHLDCQDAPLSTQMDSLLNAEEYQKVLYDTYSLRRILSSLGEEVFHKIASVYAANSVALGGFSYQQISTPVSYWLATKSLNSKGSDETYLALKQISSRVTLETEEADHFDIIQRKKNDLILTAISSLMDSEDKLEEIN